MLALPWLTAYGLAALLTPQDDPALWEAALQAHWPHPRDPACLVEALRFDIGRRLADGEDPQGETNQMHAAQRGMVDIHEWCFERIDGEHLRVKTCPPAATPPASALLGLGLSTMMIPPGGVITAETTFTPPAPLPQLVFIYLGISRPGLQEAVVYSATSAPGVGEGKALLWRRQPDDWQPTDQRVTWWIT